MKKIIALVLAMMMLVFVLASCGEAKPADDTNDDVDVVDTTAGDVDEPDESEEETEAEFEPITEGTIDLSDGLVSVELADGWKVEKEEKLTDSSVEMVNDAVTDFLSNVEVSVHRIFTDGEGAEYWANTTNGNYGGVGKVTEEDINGIHFFHLSGVVDDDDQNLFFADINDDYYLEVSVMFTALENGIGVIDNVTING